MHEKYIKMFSLSTVLSFNNEGNVKCDDYKEVLIQEVKK